MSIAHFNSRKLCSFEFAEIKYWGRFESHFSSVTVRSPRRPNKHSLSLLSTSVSLHISLINNNINTTNEYNKDKVQYQTKMNHLP